MESATRHERGLARLKELGDEPGGDAFIERICAKLFKGLDPMDGHRSRSLHKLIVSRPGCLSRLSTAKALFPPKQLL